MTTEELVKDIQTSNLFVRFLEQGAGMPTSNFIFGVAGASKTVYSAESYYSKKSFEEKFGSSKHRSVSAEHLKTLIIDNDDIDLDFQDSLYNTVFASTFQVGDIENKTSTHGWIAIKVYGGWTKYFHISIHQAMHRNSYIKLIGEIGVKLLHAKNESVPNDCYVDIVLDRDLKPLVKETLEFVSKCKDSVSVFRNGKIERLEEITRDTKDLVVYKGSFNPPSIAHQIIAHKSMEHLNKDGNTKIAFCLSFNTYDKGLQQIESFEKRIAYISKMFIPVIVMHPPLFSETDDILRRKFKGDIIFPLGVDTFNRLVKQMGSIGNVEMFFYFSKPGTTKFLIFKRNGEEICEDISSDTYKRFLTVIDLDVKASSTEIRQHMENKNADGLIGLVPMELYQDLVASMDKK